MTFERNASHSRSLREMLFTMRLRDDVWTNHVQQRPAGRSDGTGEFPRDYCSLSVSPAAVAER